MTSVKQSDLRSDPMLCSRRSTINATQRYPAFLPLWLWPCKLFHFGLWQRAVSIN